MAPGLYDSLAWLPRPPEDFGAQCRHLDSMPEPGRFIQGLALCGLAERELRQLSSAIRRAREAGRSMAPLIPFRLGVLGNGTLDLLMPALVGSAARYGIALECVGTEYGQIMQEALLPTSRINSAKLDAVLLVMDYRILPVISVTAGEVEANAAISRAILELRAIRNGLSDHGGAVVIVQTMAPPPETMFGCFEGSVPGTLRSLVAAFNHALIDELAGSVDIIFDVAALAETVGLGRWHSPAEWNLAKLPFANELVPIYADHAARVIGAMRGKSRRCLVLDLDNTLWGGVIGDDGLDGIRIAEGDAAGEAYLAVQRLALGLRDRGVVLAVSSKNNDLIAPGLFNAVSPRSFPAGGRFRRGRRGSGPGVVMRPCWP